MKKVYCKNCKWIIGFLYCSRYIGYLGKTLEQAEPEEVTVANINRNYDCPAYERKWWRVWVK